LNSNLKKVLRE